jgi:hypothetical protein
MVVEPIVATSHAERLVVLLPALVVGVGLVAGVVILLGRAFADSVRSWGHPRLLAAGLVALLGAVVLLTWLGVSLPKE